MGLPSSKERKPTTEIACAIDIGILYKCSGNSLGFYYLPVMLAQPSIMNVHISVDAIEMLPHAIRAKTQGLNSPVLIAALFASTFHVRFRKATGETKYYFLFV